MAGSRARKQNQRLRTQLRAVSRGRAPLRVGPGSGTNAPQGAVQRGESISFDQNIARRDANAIRRSAEIAQLRTQRTAQKVQAAGKIPDIQRIREIEGFKIAHGGSQGSIAPKKIPIEDTPAGKAAQKKKIAEILNQGGPVSASFPDQANRPFSSQDKKRYDLLAAQSRRSSLTPEAQRELQDLQERNPAASGEAAKFTAEDILDLGIVTPGGLIKKGIKAGFKKAEQEILENAIKTGEKVVVGSFDEGPLAMELRRLGLAKSPKTRLASDVEQNAFRNKITELVVKEAPEVQQAIIREAAKKVDDIVETTTPVLKKYTSTTNKWTTKTFWKEFAKREADELGSATDLGRIAAKTTVIGAKEIPTLMGGKVASNSKTWKIVREAGEKAVEKISNPSLRQAVYVAGGAAGLLGAGWASKSFATWQYDDDVLKPAERKWEQARATKDPKIMKQADIMMALVTDPDWLEGTFGDMPFITNFVQSNRIREQTKMGMEISLAINEFKARERERIEAGEVVTDFQIENAAVREAKEKSERELTDYFNEQSRLTTTWEQEARAEGREEESEFWIEHKKKIIELEKKAAEDLAEFWFAYRKRILKLQEQHGPSQLAFGGGFR